MMKQLVLVGTLAVALGAGAASAHSTMASQMGAGHTTPKAQPDTAPDPSVPSGGMALGSVHLAKAVKADGKTLAAGTYQVRLTTDAASTDNAKGESQGLERWVEFVQRGQVKGREVVSIVPQSEIGQVQKDTPPHPNTSKVEMLKGGEYVRVWINKGGNHYLLHLPTA